MDRYYSSWINNLKGDTTKAKLELTQQSSGLATSTQITTGGLPLKGGPPFVF